MQNTAKQNYPGSVIIYNTRPGNEMGLFNNVRRKKDHEDKPIKPCQMTWKMKLLRKLLMVVSRPRENGFWWSYISTSSRILTRQHFTTLASDNVPTSQTINHNTQLINQNVTSFERLGDVGFNAVAFGRRGPGFTSRPCHYATGTTWARCLPILPHSLFSSNKLGCKREFYGWADLMA